MKNTLAFLTAITCLIYSNQSFAFKIGYKSKYNSESNRFISEKSKPVHENLFIDAMNRTRFVFENEQERIDFIQYVAKGSVWNDDPQSQLNKHPVDFVTNVLIGCEGKKVNDNYDLLYRSHCGNLQFLHAMASDRYEVAEQTRKFIIAWIEYCYKIATNFRNEHGGVMHHYLRSIEMVISKESADVIKDRVMANKGREKWHAAGIFNLRCDRDIKISWRNITKLKCRDHKYSKYQVENIALGSILHLIQDSYSRSHTQRTEEGIVRFGLYEDQSHHSDADSDYEPPSDGTIELIEVSCWIIDHVLNQRRLGTSNWPAFKEKMEKVFALAEGQEGALPGNLGY